MNSTILCCRNLSKHFCKVVALEDINLEIKQGELFGLLGVNGAGKTTLIKCIIKLINPTSGRIFFKDNPILNRDIQDNFGFLPENYMPPGNFSARELLGVLGWGMCVESSRIQVCLQQVGLAEYADRLIKKYSRGMIQRLGLALALLKDPEMIILDEPTLGLDPLGQDLILNLLVTLNKQGKTIFFSSHNLSQIEKMCHRIGIIHRGELGFVGGITEFVNKQKNASFEEAFLKEIRQNESNSFRSFV